MTSNQSLGCTVTLSGAAPSGGVTVALTKNHAALTVPASVAVASGASSANFTVAAGTVSSDTAVTVTGSANSSSRSVTVTVKPVVVPPPTVSGLTCAASQVTSNQSLGCTVTLSGAAPSGGVTVALTKNHAALTVPASVAVASGASSANFNVAAGTVSSDTPVTVTGSANSSSRSVTVTVKPIVVPPPTVSGLTCAASQVTSNQSLGCTVTLSGAAPSGGVTVALTKNHAALTVPASVAVASGASSANFTVAAGTVSSDTAVTVTGSANSSSRSVTVTVKPVVVPPPTVSGLTCAASQVTSNQSLGCTVTLSGAAPSGGVTVALTKNHAALTVPASVAVASGASSANFTVAAGTVSSDTAVTVTGSANSSSRSVTVTVKPVVVPPPTVSGLTCAASQVTSNQSLGCTVTLSGAAPSGGVTVALTKNHAALTVPASVAVASGASSANFTVAAGTVSSDTAVTVTGSANSSSRSVTVTVKPVVVPPPTVSGLTCAAPQVTSNQSLGCTVTLSGAAPSGGVTVALTKNHAALTVPASVAVASGASSANFTVAAGTVSSDTAVTVTGSANSSSRSVTVTVKPVVVPPPTVSALTCAAPQVTSNQSLGCTVTLSGAAPSAGVTVALTKNHAALTVPASVAVASGASSANFTVAAGTVSSDTAVTVTGSANSSSRSVTVTVKPVVVPPPTVTALTCAAPQVTSNQSLGCTVTLSGAAPSAGVTVALTKNHAALTVPASVAVASGASSANFTVVAGTVSSDAAVTVTGSANSTSASASVTVKPASAGATLSSLSCTPLQLASFGASTCTVGLSQPAPAGGMQVSLTKGSGPMTMPGSVNVAPGTTNTTFSATAGEVLTNQNVTVTATASGISRNVVFALSAPSDGQSMNLSSLSCTPTTLSAGESATCTLVLSQASPSPGTTVGLSSSHAAIGVPVSVTVPNGSSRVTFMATSLSSTITGASQVTATLGASVQTAEISFGGAAAGSISSLSCSPTGLTGGGSSLCMVQLASAAPAGGTVVALSSNNSVLSVPGSITVPAGSKSAQFSASAHLVVSDGSATVEASAAGSAKASVIALTGIRPVSLSCSPSSVVAGQQLNCEVVLNSDTFGADLHIALTSSSANVAVPAALTARPGQRSFSFRANTSAPASQQSVVLTAALGNASLSHTVTLLSTFTPLLTVPGPQVVIIDSTVEFSVSTVDPTGQQVTLTTSPMPAGARFDVANKFSWTPTKSSLGVHPITFTARNAIGYSASATVAVSVVVDEPILGGIVNSASYSTDLFCSAGGLASIFGTGFTREAPSAAEALPLPTELSGVRVKINDHYASLLYASGTQVNLQCPMLPADTPLQVIIESDLGVSAPFEAIMQHASPGIFTLQATGTGQGAVALASTGDMAMVTDPTIPSAPARLEDFISIYGTGLGPVDTDVPAGEPAPLDRPSVLLSDIQVTIGDVFGDVQFAGLAPGYVGLYQVNAKIPSFAPTGDQVPVRLLVRFPNGHIAESNTVTIAIEKQ